MFKILLTLILSFGAFASHAGFVELSYLNFADTGIETSESNLELKTGVSLAGTLFNKSLNYEVEAGAYAVTFFDFMGTLPLLNISYNLGMGSLSLGRKHPEATLFIDETWGFGLTQAQLRMEPFFTTPQGRVGASYLFKSKSVSIEFFASPISIPDQSPSYNLKSSEINSDNPWALLPPSVIRIEETGQIFNLKYSISGDNIPELISNHQYGGSFSIESDYVRVDAMYSNRPSKQLGFSIDPKLIDLGLVSVKASPFYLREHLFGVQVGSVWHEGLKVKNGFYALVVDSSELDEGVKYQTSMSDYFFVNTAVEFTYKRFKAELSHLYIRERLFKDPDVIYISNSGRFFHKGAFKLRLAQEFSKNLKLTGEVLYASKEKGGSFFLEADKGVSAKLRLKASIQLIQDFSKESDSFSQGSKFKDYASLDNVKIGVRYAF